MDEVRADRITLQPLQAEEIYYYYYLYLYIIYYVICLVIKTETNI